MELFDERIPVFLREELQRRYSEDVCRRVAEGYGADRLSSFRVNKLKGDVQAVRTGLEDLGIEYRNPDWAEDAFILSEKDEVIIRKSQMYENGEIYMQNLSSMLPPRIVSIPDGIDILDMCAAPGGKTTEIMSLTGGKVNVTACEKDKIRADRLRYNLQKQGCRGVNLLNCDARKLDSFLRFDMIFLDAPCSGSGTVLSDRPETYKAFSEKLVNNSSKLQYQLLSKGLSLLKSAGTLIYSTCSILPQENEEVVLRAIEGKRFKLMSCSEALRSIPSIPCSISEAIQVCPTDEYEGFFCVAIVKE